MDKKQLKRIYDIVKANEHITSGNALAAHLGMDTRKVSSIMRNHSYIRAVVNQNRKKGDTDMFNWAMSLMRPTGQEQNQC